MSRRLANGVDLAFFEFSPGLLDGVHDRLKGSKQISSSQASIIVGNWLGLQLAVISPSHLNQLSDLVESVKLAHQPRETLGVMACRDATSEETKQLGSFCCLGESKEISGELTEKILRQLPILQVEQSEFDADGMPLIGVHVPNEALFEKQTLSKAIGRLAGKFLKRPKDLLQIPHEYSKRVAIQNEVANQLEGFLKLIGS